jgi:hypothetical protein
VVLADFAPGLSWSDVLLGPLPNVYLYAANNPSESIIAKRRGYGTIVSHNVPPYGRAGADATATGAWPSCIPACTCCACFSTQTVISGLACFVQPELWRTVGP